MEDESELLKERPRTFLASWGIGEREERWRQGLGKGCAIPELE